MRHANTLIAFTAVATIGFALGWLGCAWRLVRTDPGPPTTHPLALESAPLPDQESTHP